MNELIALLGSILSEIMRCYYRDPLATCTLIG